MPSFYTLASIEKTLQDDSGANRVVRIELSPQLREEYPHFDYKLISTIRQYVRVWGEYRRPSRSIPR